MLPVTAVSHGFTRGETTCSEELSELDSIHVLDGGLADLDHGGVSLRLVFSLGVDSLASSLGLSLKSIVFTDTVAESLSALGLPDMLDSHVDTLGDDSVSDALVHNDTDGVLGHVE